MEDPSLETNIPQPPITTTTTAAASSATTATAAAAAASSSSSVPPLSYGLEDPDRLADAQVRKLLSAVLPADIQSSKEARQSLSVAGTVFVHYITALALDACQRRKRVTIQTEDIFDAIKDAELDSILEPLRAGIESYRQNSAVKRAKKSSKAKQAKTNDDDGGNINNDEMESDDDDDDDVSDNELAIEEEK